MPEVDRVLARLQPLGSLRSGMTNRAKKMHIAATPNPPTVSQADGKRQPHSQQMQGNDDCHDERDQSAANQPKNPCQALTALRVGEARKAHARLVVREQRQDEEQDAQSTIPKSMRWALRTGSFTSSADIPEGDPPDGQPNPAEGRPGALTRAVGGGGGVDPAWCAAGTLNVVGGGGVTNQTLSS